MNTLSASCKNKQFTTLFLPAGQMPAEATGPVYSAATATSIKSSVSIIAREIGCSLCDKGPTWARYFYSIVIVTSPRKSIKLWNMYPYRQSTRLLNPNPPTTDRTTVRVLTWPLVVSGAIMTDIRISDNWTQPACLWAFQRRGEARGAGDSVWRARFPLKPSRPRD